MENVLQKIVTSEVTKNFVTEKAFYENFLEITQQSWNRWKRGERGFSSKNIEFLKNIYTDYEWMLILKIVNTLESDDFDIDEYELDVDDTENFPYEFYLQAKQEIAKQWIKNGADIEIIDNEFEDDEDRTNPGSKIIISVNYDLPLVNENDVLTFHFTDIKGKLKSKKKKRKKWFKKNQKNII